MHCNNTLKIFYLSTEFLSRGFIDSSAQTADESVSNPSGKSGLQGRDLVMTAPQESAGLIHLIDRSPLDILDLPVQPVVRCAEAVAAAPLSCASKRC